MVKANKQRGEINIEGPEGEQYRLCLTLGAIAQIEEDLGVESLASIGDQMDKMGMRAALAIFVALLNGGGHKEITKKDMMDWNTDIQELMAKITEAFKAAGFGDEEEEDEEESGN